MSKTIEERIKYLEFCANAYETTGNTPLTDDEYDIEYAACRKLAPDDPFFKKVGGIDTEHIYGTEVKHKYVMGSLNKDPNPTDFGSWFKKTYPNTNGVIAILQPKVDGSSFCLIYQDKKLVRGVTRGDGEKGFDFTPNALFIDGVKKMIKADGYVEIKGEVYKNRQDFYNKWATQYKNPRNFTAGSINQKDPLVTKDRGLSFVAYEVRGIDFKTEVDKIKFLVDNGFESLKEHTSKIDCSGRSSDEVVKAIQKYMDRFDRDKMPYDLDGVVFKLNDIEQAESMGTTDEGRRPKANRAVKFPTDKKETLLEGVEWNVGRTGALTPVGLLKPVELAGTTVKRVTLHNIKEMVERLGITKIGARVIVAKQGDIIPKVLSVVKDGDGDKIVIPNNCPVCNEQLAWDDTHTTKVCGNFDCPSQVDRRIEHYFKTIDVLGIGPGIISKLTSECTNSHNPMVSKISDMYGLGHYISELENIFGDKAAQNILTAVDSVKEMPLATLIEGLGIANIGRMSKDIVANAPTIKDVDALTVEDIVKIPGFAETKAKNFVGGWKKYRGEIDKILKYISIVEVKLDSNKLAGKKFCFTGSFSNPSRSDMEKLVEDNGGKNSSVSKELTALVWDGAMNGSKIDKAKKLNLPIISQKDFLAMLK